MLKRLNRLTKTKDIERVYRSGQSSHNQYIGVKSIKNQLKYSRFTVIVSNKISKKAVVRNKLKRQIRSVIEKKLDYISPGFDNIIITKPAIIDCEYFDLEKYIILHFNKLNLVNDPN